ncbi:DnaJ C-terminal domain-containing protein [Sphingomonas sp.]|uniref:DnaJ C-terminal domain-containing protein n=1 Tax=Sphingomonas sp. TaxID=28214 RepID=UPI0025EE51AB|nr:DnaJ C-terminal domain-containing protein [Sphingomonas sp.]
MADPYTTLGVARGATEADIKKAYRKLAKELHPDKNKDNPKATERFSTVTAAYDLLSDKDKRARFDRGEIDGDGNPAAPFGYGAGGGGGFRGQPQAAGSADFGDIFEGLFGGRRGGGGAGFGGRAAPPQRGANIGYRLAVPFEDAASLAPQRITLGDGKSIDLKLPPGVETGTQMRLGGKGEPGPGGPGDAVVTIEIDTHRFYKRDGDAVRLDLPITIAEAVLGGPVKVPTVDGPVMLNIPPASSSGKVLRLKNRGFTGKTGVRGDQLVTLMIAVPAADDPVTETLKSWSESERINLGNPRAALGV